MVRMKPLIRKLHMFFVWLRWRIALASARAMAEHGVDAFNVDFAKCRATVLARVRVLEEMGVRNGWLKPLEN